MIALGITALFFIVAITALLRYTQKSVGVDSPLHQRVTYQITAGDYFTRFGYIFLFVLGILVVYLSYVVLRYALPTATTVWHYALVVSCIGVSVVALYMINLVFRLDEQYWRITRDVVVTLDPDEKRLTIQYPTQTISFVAKDLRAIERVGAGFHSSKLVRGYEHWYFHLIDGRVALLNRYSSYLDHVLETYFGHVPIIYQERRVPWIEPINRSESIPG